MTFFKDVLGVWRMRMRFVVGPYVEGREAVLGREYEDSLDEAVAMVIIR